jgi:membrane protease YdiL (CAAX protease family)
MLRTLLVLGEVLGFTLLVSAFRSLLWGTMGTSGIGEVLVWPAYGMVILALAAALNKIEYGKGLRALGFRFHTGFWKDLWTGVVAYAVLYIAALPFEIAALTDRARLTAPMMQQFGLSSMSQIVLVGGLLAMLFGFLTGAFHEEILFRGYYQGTGSRGLSPAAGFFIALLPFTLGHYSSHPEWSIAQVVATLMPGVALGLLYGATGSLVAVMSLHTMANWIDAYPVLVLVASQSRSASLLLAGAVAGIFLVLIWARRHHEIRMLAKAIGDLFQKSSWTSMISGLLIGTVLIAIWPYRPNGIWAALGGASLIALVLAARRFWNVRPSQDAETD